MYCWEALKLRMSSNTIKWPVEEMGRNSVMPSTIPSKKDLIQNKTLSIQNSLSGLFLESYEMLSGIIPHSQGNGKGLGKDYLLSKNGTVGLFCPGIR